MEQLNLKVTLNKNGSFTITWSRISNAINYELQLYNVTPIIYTYINEKNLVSTTYTTKGNFPHNEQYDIVVSANSSTNSNIMDEGVRILIPWGFYDNYPLGIPEKISAKATTTSVTITYEEVDRATGYDILFNGTTYSPNEFNKTYKKFEGLSPKTNYTYSVRAKNLTLIGAYSAVKTVMTLPMTPNAPPNMYLTVTENTVKVDWGASNAATSYEVLFNGVTYSVTGTSRTFTGLTPNKTYTCAVRAKNADGYSAYCATRTFTTTPNPPANANVTTDEGSVTISWSPVSGATSYDVILNGTTYRVTDTSKKFTDLSANTGYTYQVRANNADGSSSYSPVKTVKTAPNPPANANVTPAKNSVTLSWSAAAGATSYDIIFNGTTYNVTGTSKTFSGLQPGTTCTYQVRSNSAGGSSSYSDKKTVTTIPNPPNMPSGVGASATADSVTVSWDAVAGAASYDILWNDTLYNVTGTSKTITGLLPDTSYLYKVRANNAGGSSTYSYLLSVRTLFNPPTVPTNINATATTNSVTVSFSAVSGAKSYDIIFNGTTYNMYSSTSKTFIGLSAGTSYTYQVRANNTGGSSPYSDTKTVTTIPNPPAMPTNVNATATADSVTVSFSAVSGAASYDIVFKGTTYNVTGTSRTFTGLSTDTNYTYQVRANNAGGSSAYSAVKTIRTSLAPPTVPLNVSATATFNSATVSFSAVSGAASYDVWFNGTAYNVTSTYKTITGLSPNTTYTYQVRANNAKGTSAYSAAKTVTTQLTPLPIPANVNATATTNSVTVSYDAVSGATGYDILFNGTTYSVAGTSRIFTGLLPGTNCTYYVRAKNASVTSSYSAAKTIQTIPNPPAVPADTSATATADTATVSFGAVSGATGYDIIFNGTTYNVTETSRTFTGLTPDTSYTYSVSAKNAGGSSPFSIVKAVRTLLGIPADISATATAKTVTVSYSTVSGATSYDINFNGTIYRVPGTLGEFTELTPDTNYTYQVRANNSTGSGAYSQTETIRTLLDVPAVPSDVSATSTLNGVIVSWSPVTDAASYDVKFDDEVYHVEGTTRMFTVLRNESPNTGGASKVFSGLKPNTKHGYCVRANGEAGSSNYSPVKNILTKKSKKNGLPNVKLNKKYPDGKVPHMGLDPVNALTGAFLWSYTYLEEYGKNPLNFTAMYDSQRDEYHTALGRKWTYSYSYLLYMDSEYAYFSTPYDEVIPFAIDTANGTFLLAEGIRSDYTMGKKEDQTYYVRDMDGVEYQFDSSLCLSRIIEGGIATYRFGKNEDGQITSITGQHGGTLELENTDGHITRVGDTMGNVVTFVFNGDYLVSAVNLNGDSMTFTYDASGNLLEITDFSGKSHVSNRYDSRNRVIMQNTANRGDTFASYDEANRVTTFTDELGNTTQYSYDEGQHVTSVELAGTSVQSKYNESGQLTEQMDALGNTTQMSYDEYGRMNHVTHPDESEEYIYYNDRNYPVRIVNRDGSESAYGYDAGNNLVSAADERGNLSNYSYDSHGNMVSYTGKNGHAWTYTYDNNHHLKQATDPEGNIHQYSHDAIGRLLSFTTPTGNMTAYHYSGAGDLLTITDADGTVAFDYNENGNNTGITDRMGNKQRLEYNEMGLVSLATDCMGNEYEFTYDKRGALVKETDPLGYSQRYAYDAMGNQTAWTDKNGNTTNHSFNAANQLTEVRDAAGSTISYSYDTMGRIKIVTDPLNNQTNYTYDKMGRVTGITNALGHSVGCTYDQAGNLLTQTDEKGAVTTYTYENENRVKSITSNLGTIRFTYDSLGRVTTVQDVDGHSEKTLYDADGNITEATDKESGKTTYVYGNSGHLSAETDANGNKTFYEYDKNGNCTKLTDAEGNVYSYEYDVNGRLEKGTNPMGHETSYGYDAGGNLTTVTDARGGKTSFEYDGNGNLIKEISPIAGEKVYSYDSLNRLTDATDEEGHKQSYTYDANGNMTSYTDGNQNKWEYEYDAINRRTGMTDQNGGHIVFSYGKKDELAKVTDQEGAETTYCYDLSGRLTKMSDALQNSLNFTYDSLGRTITQTDAGGNTTEYEYSPSGNLLKVKDPEGNITAYTYNALGQVLTETDALGNVTTYKYDTLGRTTTITDASGGKTSFTYTGSGEIATVTDADGKITSYGYDACGNLIQTTDPSGITVAYEYDAMNNRIKEYVSNPAEQSCATIYRYDKKSRMVREINPLLDEKVYTYDGNGNITTILDEDKNITGVMYDLNNKPVSMSYSDGKKAAFRYNKRGELVELKDWNGTVTMEYGKTGKLAKVTDHNGRITGYRYDANGNTTGIDYPDGSAVGYTYDKNNRMTTVQDAGEQAMQYEYDAAGNTVAIRQPGSTSTYAYNALGLPTQVKYQLTDGTWMENKLAYDALGNIVGSDRKGSSPELTKKAAYSYDPLGQLISYKEGQVTEAYGYDPLGNRVTKTINGIQEATCQYNALNQLTARTENGIPYSYGYDKRGNQTEERCGGNLTKQYTYDATGHMVMGRNLESGEKTEYGYNALYTRIKNVQTLVNRPNSYTSHAVKPEGGGRLEPFKTRETSYVADYLSGTNNELVSYEKGKGATKVTYGRGYERLSQTVTPGMPGTSTAVSQTSMGSSYFQSDLLGSPLFASNKQGEVLRYAERSAWGELKIPVQGDPNFAGVEDSIRYTNYGYDPVIDKHFAQARFYDVGQGRMLAKDPVKRGLNAYPYCKNNPVNYVDPTGEIANILAGAAIGGAVGGIFGLAGSALSQIGSGEGFSVKKALGSAANGAVVGAARGAIVSSGAGLALSLASNFAAGTVGSTMEQQIGRGKTSLRESITSGLTNAISGAAYGNAPLKSAKDALGRGALSGGATAAINNLSNAWNPQNGVRKSNGRTPGRLSGGGNYSPYTGRRDPKAGCSTQKPFSGNLGYSTGNGYQYVETRTEETRQGGFNLGNFVKDVLIGTAMGGLSSLSFYGAGKAVEGIKNSIKGGSPVNPSSQIKGNSYDINKLQKTQPYTYPENVSSIKGTIAQNGPNSVPPIEIRVNKGSVLVVDGHHRLEAFSQLGYDRVPIKYLHGSQLGKTLSNGTYYRSLQELLDAARISN